MNLRKTTLRLIPVHLKTRAACLVPLFTAALVVAAGNPLSAAPDSSKKEPGKESKAALKSYTGTLKTGVMAIGAETTGYTLTTAGEEVYELDFKNPKLKAKADTLGGKNVTVEGIYKSRAGVEVKEREIIEVKKLTEN